MRLPKSKYLKLQSARSFQQIFPIEILNVTVTYKSTQSHLILDLEH